MVFTWNDGDFHGRNVSFREGNLDSDEDVQPSPHHLHKQSVVKPQKLGDFTPSTSPGVRSTEAGKHLRRLERRVEYNFLLGMSSGNDYVYLYIIYIYI